MEFKEPFSKDEYESSSDPFGYENNPEDLKRLHILLNLIPEMTLDRVLDLGCGNGFVTSEINNAQEVVGIDSSQKAVDLANYRFKKNQLKNHMAIQKNILTDSVSELGKFNLIIVTGTFYTHYLGHNHKLIESKCNELLKIMGYMISTHILEIPHSIPSLNFLVVDRMIYNYKDYTHEIIVQRKIK